MATALGISNSKHGVARMITRRNAGASCHAILVSSDSNEQQKRCYHFISFSASDNKTIDDERADQLHRRRLHSFSTCAHNWKKFNLIGSKVPSNIFKSGTSRGFSSDNKRDFYDVLGVQRGADKGTIKKAYFKLAKQFHPDTNQGDKAAAEKFKEVTEAYECLSDDKQRELYDTYGHAGVDPNFAGAGGGNPFSGFSGFEGMNFNDGSFHFSSSGPGGQIDPEDLFDAFFGGGRRRPRGPRRGSDLQMHVRLSFEEAVFGASKDLHLRYQIRDAATGRVEIKEREVTVETPAGIDNGMNLRLQGQGAEGDPGAPRGNLLVTVIVEEDDYFQRDGADVHTSNPISVTQAILGGTIDVKTLTGSVEMKVPKGAQPDTKLVMRGKGIQYVNSARKGNHIVHLDLKIPKTISAKQEELLRQFDEESKETGLGFTGRIAKAAGSAFETFFGKDCSETDTKKDSSDDPQKQKDNKGEEEIKNENSESQEENDDSNMEENERKQQAQ